MQVGPASAPRTALTAAWGRVPTDVRLFLAIMALLVPARIAHTAQVRSMYTDGGYYLEVAKHVRDGHGLATHLSLYHFGYETFPHPTSVYPLWPWLLGMAGRLFDIELLAHWLPLALSFLAVTAAFLFGRRLWPEPLFPQQVPGLHAGHVFALGLALQGDFLFFSSMPYTEPLAWGLLFLFCWRVTDKGADPGWPWAVETGLWLGLLYLARFQFLVAPMAMALAYALRLLLGTDGVSRSRILGHGALALGVAGLLIGGWFWRLTSFVHEPRLSSLLRFDQNKANDLLHPVDVIVENRGILDLLLDRAQGFLVAWDPASSSSYAASFHTLHWALAFALPLMLVSGVRTLRREGLEGVVARLRRPEVAHWWFLLLFALGALLSVHAIHKHFNGQWYFSNRQGMISLLAFLLSLGWLLRQQRPPALALGVLVLSSTLMLGTHRLWTYVTDLPRDLRQDETYSELIAWMKAQQQPGQPLVVALDSQVQRVAWRTEGIGYHWVYADTPYEDYLTLTDRLNVRYIILRKKALDRKWKLLSNPSRLERDFVQVSGGPDTHVVYERRR